MMHLIEVLDSLTDRWGRCLTAVGFSSADLTSEPENFTGAQFSQSSGDTREELAGGRP
jgi:hypothetical protein